MSFYLIVRCSKQTLGGVILISKSEVLGDGLNITTKESALRFETFIKTKRATQKAALPKNHLCSLVDYPRCKSGAAPKSDRTTR